MAVSRIVVTPNPVLNQTILNNAKFTSIEQDGIGNDNSQGQAFVYLTYVSAAVVGNVQVYLAMGPVTGGVATTRPTLLNSFVPNGVGETNIFVANKPFDRFWEISVMNQATGLSLTGVNVIVSFYKLF